MDLPSRAMALPDVPGAGGGASYDPFAPPSAPSGQALASGTTSSSAITWGTPTGGSGSYSTATALAHVVGSGASLSGGDTVTGLEDGDVVVVTRTWTDDETGQTVARSVGVSVAVVPGAYDWIDEVFFAFQNATLAGPWTSGTNAVSGAAASSVNTITTQSTPTNGTTEVVAAGLRTAASTGSGNVNTAVDLSAFIPANNAYFTDGPGVVVIQACYVGSSLGGTGTYWVAGLSNKNIQGQAFCGIAANYSAGNVAVTTYYDTLSGVSLYSGAIPTEWRVSVYIYMGRVSRVRFEAGVSTPTDTPPDSGWTFAGHPSITASTGQFFGDSGGAAAKWLTSVRSNGSAAGVTLTDLRVWRMEATA